mgnify:CR=1 FL=1
MDWNADNQPTHDEAFSKLIPRIHPGAIVLLHNTSKTNGEILDELLTKLGRNGIFLLKHLKNFRKSLIFNAIFVILLSIRRVASIHGCQGKSLWQPIFFD